MPFGGDLGSDHLWIADAALSVRRPLGWAELTDADGTQYYQNTVTDEVMWEHPQISFLRGAVAVINHARATANSASPAAKEVFARRKAAAAEAAKKVRSPAGTEGAAA